MEYETISWKERCNRYFSSISDTAKDGDQEKDHKEVKDNSWEGADKHPKDTDDESKWKDLGEIKKKVVGGKLRRYMRKILNSLDIHGAKFAGKSGNAAELAAWIVIIVIAITAVFVLIFFTVREYRTSKDTFTISRTTSIQSSTSSSIAAMTVCNLNLLRKDSVKGTRFSYLRNLEERKPEFVSETEEISLDGIIADNSKLTDIIVRDTGIDVKAIVNELESDLDVMEVLKKSSLSVDYRLAQNGQWDIVRSRVLPTMTEVESLGHQIHDMVVDCRIGYRRCKKSEIQPAPDPKYGNCFQIVPEDGSATVDVVLDAQEEQYLHSVTPSVGFSVSVHDSGDDLASGETVLLGTSQHALIKVLEERVTERNAPCSDSYRTRQCLGECLETHKMDLCGCKEDTDESGPACDHANAAQYICLKVVRLLHMKNKLPCNCLDRCRDIHLTIGSSSIVWPSEYNMDRMERFLQLNGKQMNKTQIRNSLAKVTVSLRPEVQETRRQNGDKSLLKLLAQIGGLSALIVGLSAVTLVELLWTLVRITVDFIAYLCKRSNNGRSLQRLTDSEITSITWAVYRQKRRREEMNKEAESAAHHRRSLTTIGGNVPNRLQRRNSNGSKIYEDLDQFELRRSNGEERHDDHSNDKYRSTHLNNNIKAERNGYRKHGYSNTRLHSISEEKRESAKSAEGIRTISENPYYDRSVQSNGQAHSDPRYRSHYATRVPYVRPGSTEGVRLYGSSGAYFYNTSAEPTYL